MCDRYAVYKALAKDIAIIILAFCWAHVRRDFIELARSRVEFRDWSFVWIEDIRELYRLNKNRIEVWDKNQPMTQQSSSFREAHDKLSSKLTQMKNRFSLEIKNKELKKPQKLLMESLENHWEGLNVFLNHPEVPMDNNSAERSIRGPVIGRKNYYGSGSVWSSKLMAMLLTILNTILLWKLNPRHWLKLFLQACADHGGKPPSDLSDFLPWQMKDSRMQELSNPPPEKWTASVTGYFTEASSIDTS